jgi:hypothetical protein
MKISSRGETRDQVFQSTGIRAHFFSRWSGKKEQLTPGFETQILGWAIISKLFLISDRESTIMPYIENFRFEIRRKFQ